MRFILTMALGAIPATVLCGYMPFLLAIGMSSYQVGSVASAVKLILTSLAAVSGTVSLWVVASKAPSAITCLGLLAGLAAIAPFTYAFLLGEGALQFQNWMKFLFFGPPVVALYWVANFFYSLGTKSARSHTI